MRSMLGWLGSILLLASVVCTGTGCSKQFKKTWHLSRANRDFQAGKYESAEVSYLKVIKAERTNAEAIRQLGFIYQEQGKLVQALDPLRQAAQMETNNALVQVKYGMTLYGLGSAREARQLALRALDLKPGFEDALSLLADTADSTNAINEVRQTISQHRQKDSDRAGYYAAFGTLYLKERQVVQAEQEFQKALQLDPKSAVAYAGMGAIHLSRTNLTEADKALKLAADLSPLRSGHRIRYAEFKRQTGAFEDAKKQMTELSRKVPDFLPVWNMLAQIARSENNDEDYDAMLKRVLARDPINLNAMEQRGRFLLGKREAAQATSVYERMTTVYERLPQGYLGLARAYLVSGDSTNKALANYEKAIKLNTNYAEAIIELARLNLATGKQAAGTKLLRDFVQHNSKSPASIDARLVLAAGHIRNGDYNAALQTYASITNDFPAQARNPQIPLLMGNIYATQGTKGAKTARECYERALSLSPDFWLALEGISVAYQREGNFQSAVDRIDREVKRRPDAVEPLLLLAGVRFAQAKAALAAEQKRTKAESLPKLAAVPAAQKAMEQADAAAQKAVQLAPDLEPAHNTLAQLYVFSDRHPQALDTLNNFVAKTNAPVALMQIGLIQTYLKNYEAARDAYEKLLKLRPNDGAVLNNLAYLYCENLGKMDRAEQLAEQARQALPTSPSALDTLGWVLFKKGDHGRALPLLREASDRSPRPEPEIQYHLGLACYMTGDEAMAVRSLQIAIDGTKDFPGQEEARKRLEMLAVDPNSAGNEVLAKLEKRLSEEPKDPVALNRIARIYEKTGAIDKARGAYEAAIKRNSRDALAMIGLARLLLGQGSDLGRALQLAKDARALDLDNDEVTRTLGLLVFKSGDWKYAANLLKDAVRTTPNDSELWYALAWSSYAVGQFADAESAMQKVSRPGISATRAKAADQFLALLAAYKTPGQAQAALPTANEVLKSDPKDDDVPALMVVAAVAVQQGRYEDAKRAYESAMAIYPDFAPATHDLALLYGERLGDYQKAYELGNRVRATFPNDPRLSKTLGIAAYMRGDMQAAGQFLGSAQQRKDDPEGLFYLGMTQYKLNQKREAKTTLEAAVKLKLPPNLLQDAQRTLDEMGKSAATK